jgi:hypothetical protein
MAQESNNVFAGIGNAETLSNNVSAASILVAALSLTSLSLAPPAVLNIAAGTTTGTIVSLDATGGTAPYTYSAAITFDSSGAGTASISGISGKNISLQFLTNGLYLEVTITATDSLGATASVTAGVLVASVAAGTMTPGAFPASQLLASSETTASISFNPVGGVFTAPVTYVATVQSGTAGISNIGTAVSLTGLSQDTVVLVRLRATDSTGGTPLVADAFALIEVQADVTNPLIYSVIREIDFTDPANAAGPFVNGSQSVNLLDKNTGATVGCTLIHSMAAGSFATMTSQIISGTGWKLGFAATATPTFCNGPLLIPLPSSIGFDDDVVVTIVGYSNQPVSNNSSYFQVARTGSTPSQDSTNCWGGFRILRSAVAQTALFINAQGGTAGTTLTTVTTPPCPLTWVGGAVQLTLRLYLPRYANRARVNMNGTGSSIVCDLGAAAVVASSTANRGGWIAGNSGFWLYHGASNGGGNGLGAQFSTITSIKFERRTLP